MLDIVFKNALIYDGTGSPAYRSNLGIKGRRIAAISTEVLEAKTGIDADGLSLAPGFIDSHSHADLSVFRDSHRNFVTEMGVTTEVAGQCGNSLCPSLPTANESGLHAPVSAGGTGEVLFETFDEEKNAIDQLEMGTNLLCYVGHGNIRFAAMGLADRQASAAELDYMRQLLDKAIQSGALGMSTGLSYEPGIYANTQELIELSKAVARYGGMYVTHARSESAGLLKSTRECISIAEEANLPVHISHLKCTGREFWSQCETVLQMIDEANARGLRVTMDAYPYTAVSTTTTSAIPPRFLTDGREALASSLYDPDCCEAIRKEIFEIDDPSWDNSALHVGLENFLITGAEHTPQYVGMTYAQAGEELGISPFDAMMKILRENHGYVFDVRFAMCEENVESILSHPLCGVGSDGIYVPGRDTMTHPRAFGAFPRYLGHYIRDRQILSREEGIHRITGMPAERFGIQNKGFLRIGYDADLVLFDFDTIADGGTFETPFLPNRGIHQVYMNGQLVMQDNEATGVYVGRMLKANR